MKLNRFVVRRVILILLVLAVFGVYIARLMNIQIVQAEEIRSRLEAGSISKQVVKATRGEIVDQGGKSLVSNSLGYDVIIDSAFLPVAGRNDVVLELIRLFEKNGVEWIDNLPVTLYQPFGFLPGEAYENSILKLKEKLEVHPYTSVEDTMYHLRERYSLKGDADARENAGVRYSDADARKIAGVRYEMERRGFNANNPYTFANNIPIELVLQIKERSHLLSGVDVYESAIRQYDMGTIAPHLIGLVGPIYYEEWAAYKESGYSMDDIVGKSGVESAFEDYLRGENGERVISMDTYGKVLEAHESTPPQAGNTIVLSLDSDLQDVAQRALEAQIQYLQQNARPGEGREANAGAVVAINSKTGEVLACATYPSYDLNAYHSDYQTLAGDPLLPLVNRALQGTYAPGSTFKPVVGTAGLATGVVNELSTVLCGLIYTRFADYQPRCLRADGNINVTRALSLSCNIYFYDVGWNIGIDNIDKYTRQFGLGEPTGIELREELTGRRSNPAYAESQGYKWNNGDVLQSSIGQLYHGFTPLQLANYTAAIANGGERMKVTIVKEIQDYSRQNVIDPIEPVVADRVDASPEVFDIVTRGMVAASRTGTATAHFGSYPIDIASKTGTPEDVTFPNSTFICFGPADDAEIAIAVVIENGWHGYTGAPVAKAILDEYFGIQSPNPLLPREPSAEEIAQAAVQAASGALSEASSDENGEASSGDNSGAPEEGEASGPSDVPGEDSSETTPSPTDIDSKVTENS